MYFKKRKKWVISTVKVSLITFIVCKRQVVSTRSIVLPTSALRNVHVVTWKLDLDQTSEADTHTERYKCNKTRGHIIILGLGNDYCTG